VHAIGARAERRVELRVMGELKRVTGKTNLLFEIAGAAVARPDGTVRDVVFPVAGEQTLRDLVREWQSGPMYRRSLRTTIRSSYAGHYRRMVPRLLDALEFRSNNATHRPVTEALAPVRRYATTRLRHIPAHETVPIEGVVRPLWREAVIDAGTGGEPRATRTRTRRPTSPRAARPTTRPSGCRGTPTRSSPACGRRCARAWPGSTPGCRTTRTSGSRVGAAAGSRSRRCRPAPIPRT
jgi:hypothetical protein